jgi:hypothetical protein
MSAMTNNVANKNVLYQTKIETLEVHRDSLIDVKEAQEKEVVQLEKNLIELKEALAYQKAEIK